MRRPSFQFYPADWRNNANLRRCSWEARGVWVEVMGLMHDSDHYGLLRWPLKEIAQALGAPIKPVRELASKGVMKGSDADACEPLIYIPRSGRKDGEPVILVPAQVGPLWYSSRMVKDEYVRTIRGEGTRFGDAPKDAPIPPLDDGSTSSSSSSPTGSNAEPKGSGGKPPRDELSPDAILFGYGVPYLVEAGTKESNARSFIGKLRKLHGDASVIDKLRACMKARPSAPIEWLAAALPPEKAPPKVEWHETQSGIEDKGESLGLGRWNEGEWKAQAFRPEFSFMAYKSRVMAAHRAEAH